MYSNNTSRIPEILILAQKMQKCGDYQNSRYLYKKFFEDNKSHYLRFKALFEIADNWFHEKKYDKAYTYYIHFINYCNGAENLTEEEKYLIDSYVKLTDSRLKTISKANNGML